MNTAIKPSWWRRFLSFCNTSWPTPVRADDSESQVLGLVQLAQAHGAPLEPAAEVIGKMRKTA